MVTFDQIIREVDKHTTEFIRLYKCLKKNLQPSIPTKNKNLQLLITEYNSISNLFAKCPPKLTTVQLTEVQNRFTNLREKLVTLVEFLQLVITVPLSYETQVIYNPVPKVNNDTSFFFNFDLNLDTIEQKMTDDAATAKARFISTYAKLIPEFDGSAESLTRFTDACDLLNENVGTYMATAVTIIKTKLIGTARNYITNETTIQAIVDVLKANIKPESSKVVSSKLLGTKQGTKSATEYVKEIETLSAALKRAYLNEGVPAKSAEIYSTETVVKALTLSSGNERIKNVMQSADFKTVSEVTAKYVAVTTDNAVERAQIYYQRRSSKSYSQPRNNFVNTHGQFRSNTYDNRNFNYNRNYSNRGQGHQNYNNQRQNNFRGSSRRGYTRNVRYTENQTAPQVPLGANLETYTR